jgi:hypothetical protein
MDPNAREKELNDLVVEAIFNGVPVVLDVCGIEAFKSLDVFSYLREGSETSYHGPGYDEKNIEMASKYEDEELALAIYTVLDVFVKAGVFVCTTDDKGIDTFDPTEIAFQIRAYFINGERF